MDIIFFHGLQPDDFENAFWKTWTLPNKIQTVWPQVWIPEKFPTARILSVSVLPRHYDSYMLGEKLVVDIILDRSCAAGENCPVYLVGHCLGGIILKQFILSAIISKALMNPGPYTEAISSFLDNFAGVFYYATPHEFARTGDLASCLPSRSQNLELLKTVDKEKGRIISEFRMQLRGVPAAEVVECRPTKCGVSPAHYILNFSLIFS